MEEELIVEPNKFSNSAEAIANINGYVVFVPNACPGDKLKIKLVKQNKNYATGEIVEIIAPSDKRVKPFCPLYNACGACQLQHIDYDFQLELKRQTVEDNLKKIAGEDIEVKNVIPSPQNEEYRCKIQYPVSETKVSKRILAGYYKQNSHEIVNIKYCPVQPKICNEIIDFIRTECQSLCISGYIEKTHKGLLRHIVLRVSAFNGDILLTLVVNDNKIDEKIKKLAKECMKKFTGIKGVFANLNNKKNNVILSGKSIYLYGEEHIEEKILDKTFKISADTFFQVNPKSAEKLFEYVKNTIRNNFEKPTVLDAYAGISAFGITLSDISERVISVEENESSTSLAKEVAVLNNINNLEINTTDTGMFLEKETRKFTVSVIDPPRKGCDTKTLDNLIRLTDKMIVYVSCNSATLARDIKYLTKKGAELISIQPFDMFCHTMHVESVAIIKIK